MKTRVIKMIFLGFLLVGCAQGAKQPTEGVTRSGLEQKDFQSEVDGKPVGLYVLENKNKMEVCITNYGGRIVSIVFPDKEGKLRDVVLGFDNIKSYIDTDNNFGATIGRYGNRIAHGRFSLDGVVYQLPINNFGHCLHGGNKGFHTRVFDAEQPNGQTLVLSYTSADGEEGFPGRLQVKVQMRLTDTNALEIAYEATTDKKTIVNLTNHSYFNLSGDPSHSILDEQLMLNADRFTPIDSTFMTTGVIEGVEGTPLDFRKPTPIGKRIAQKDVQLRNANGYDHNFVLNTKDTTEVAARLFSPLTGIQLEVFTNEPGLQVYSGNFLDGTVRGKKGIAYQQHAALCLETQKYPNSPNNPSWASPVLKVGEVYKSYCIYKLGIRR
ncbi:aldose epimerase family protein [Capnocytophaga haemolytica]|jgi:hypothetical protein